MRHYVSIGSLSKPRITPKSLSFILYRAVVTTLDTLGINVCCRVKIFFACNKIIRNLNQKHRNVDKITDVLSFPMLQLSPYEKIIPVPENTDPDTGSVDLGEIILSLDTARKQAFKFGHSLKREAVYLTVHSTLHLLGFDHDTEDGDNQMRRVTNQVMERIQL